MQQLLRAGSQSPGVFAFGCSPAIDAFAEGGRGAPSDQSEPVQHIKSTPVRLSHLRQIHISYSLLFHADGRETWSKTSPLS